jgi:hypothetical protein
MKPSIFGSGLGSVSLPINGSGLILKKLAKIDMLVKKKRQQAVYFYICNYHIWWI